jgi:putative nucleotidyltransferase with HDIG domain
MAATWFERLKNWFRGDRRGPSPQQADLRTTVPIPPQGTPESEQDLFELLRVPEYDPRERGPLHPREAEALSGLCVKVREHFAESGQAQVAFPPLVRRYITLVGHDDRDVNELVQMMQQDPLVSAQLLKAANAAANLGAEEAHSVRQAIVRIGTREAARIAVAASLRTLFEMDGRPLRGDTAATWRGLWLHSMTVAFSAGWLSMHSQKGDVERAFLGGMLHDIGKTSALRSLLSLLHRGQVPAPLSPALLEAVLDAVHVELGTRLCAEWNLPAHVAAVCAGHHDPPSALLRRVALSAEGADVHLVRVVSGLDEVRKNPYHRAGLMDEVRESVAVLGLSMPQVRTLLTYLRETAARMEAQ